MIHPGDILGPSVTGPIALLVDCQTESHLLELMSLQSLGVYYKDLSNQSETSKVVTCVIHLSPASIVGSPNYQKWMKRFGSAEHIMAGHERIMLLTSLSPWLGLDSIWLYFSVISVKSASRNYHVEPLLSNVEAEAYEAHKVMPLGDSKY